MKKVKYRVFIICSIFLLIITLSGLITLFPKNTTLYYSKKITLNTYKYPETLWTNNGTLVSTGNGTQNNPQIISDGSGGAIIVWEEQRNGIDYNIFAQKIDSAGNILWGSGGIYICSSSGDQHQPQICSDGAGGAIITWYDDRGTFSHIYAQKINSSGAVQWATNGILICSKNNGQYYPKIVSDGQNGAVIVWVDYRSGVDFDIYAQRIDANGNSLWTSNGTVICNATNEQSSAEIIKSNDDFIITWADSRNATNKNIYAQKISLNGVVQWTQNGITICNALDDQDFPQLTGDNAGGAIITWEDKRSGIYYDIYAQLINSNGQIQWAQNGVIVSNAKNNQKSPAICSDGQGGAIITWHDQRSTTFDIYSQRVDSNGLIKWTPNGTAICTASGNQFHPQIISDRFGGAFITWYDQRSTDVNIYAQLIDSDGQIIWSVNGIVICNEINNQEYPKITSDGGYGGFIIWTDGRELNPKTYIQHLKDNKQPRINHPADIIATTNSYVIIKWIITDDFGPGKYRVWVNDSNSVYHIHQNWTAWQNNTVLNVNINSLNLGIFNYTIEYNDSVNLFGEPDTVMVKIIENTTDIPPGIPSFSIIFILTGLISLIMIKIRHKIKK
ncbi:MAG: hypothetical protein ACTSQO_04175 [Candidatus Helarchaeota archaeon]